MKKLAAMLPLFPVLPASLFAKCILKGQLQDTTEEIFRKRAYCYWRSDSVMVRFSRSNAEGRKLDKLPAGRFILLVTDHPMLITLTLSLDA
jgi:hypothetical protein